MFHAAMTISILFGGIFFALMYTVPGSNKEHHSPHQLQPQKHSMDEDGTHQQSIAPVIEAEKKEANLALLGLTTIDFMIRSYMTVCVYSLYVKFKSERIESDFMNESDKQRLSYGSGTGSMDKMTDNCSVINER